MTIVTRWCSIAVFCIRQEKTAIDKKIQTLSIAVYQ